MITVFKSFCFENKTKISIIIPVNIKSIFILSNSLVSKIISELILVDLEVFYGDKFYNRQ